MRLGSARRYMPNDPDAPDPPECCEECNLTKAEWDDKENDGHHSTDGWDCEACAVSGCGKTDEKCPHNQEPYCDQHPDSCRCHWGKAEDDANRGDYLYQRWKEEGY